MSIKQSARIDVEDVLKSMPKAEIHVHLEGATAPETIWKIAKRNGVILPVESLEDWKKFFHFKDFNHFIKVYLASCEAIRTAEDFTEMTVDFHRYQAAQNILYTEAFLSASLCLNKLAPHTIISALKKGCEEGQKKYGVKVAFIPDIARQFPEGQSKVVDFCINGFEDNIFLGIGLGGIEENFPPELFVDSYKRAKDAGLRLVAHAGEACGADYILNSIDVLKAERIGHGIRCLENNTLMKRLKESNIPLEVCPISNYRTKVVEAGKIHPIHEMLRHGLFCTLNSDDPAMFSTSLTNEYLYLSSTGISLKELWQLNRNTLEASFLSEDEKNQYRALWKQFESTSQAFE